MCSFTILSISDISISVNIFIYFDISSSFVFKKYWYTKYGLFLFGSNQIAFHSDLPNFLPLLSVIIGIVSPKISLLCFFLVNSIHVTMFPH